jgi:hypothetical protein
MNHTKILLTTCFLLMLTACAHIELRTAWALKSVDYVSVNPSVMRLAFSLPAGAILDQVALNLRFTRDDRLVVAHQIPIDIVTSGTEIEQVGFPPYIATKVVLRMPSARLDDIRDFQKMMQIAKDTGEKSSASIGVDSQVNQAWLKDYCAKGNTQFFIRAWIKVDESKGYLRLFGESEILKLLEGESRDFCQKKVENQ